jgi:hypothetical protein
VSEARWAWSSQYNGEETRAGGHGLAIMYYASPIPRLFLCSSSEDRTSRREAGSVFGAVGTAGIEARLALVRRYNIVSETDMRQALQRTGQYRKNALVEESKVVAMPARVQ